MRALLAILYRSLYRAYCYLSPTAIAKRFEMVRFGSYAGGHLVARIPVFAAQSTKIPSPTFLNDLGSKVGAKSCTISVDLPKIDVLELRDATVVGGTDFIIVGEDAIAPDYLVQFADTCPANLFGVTSTNHTHQSLRLFLTNRGIEIDGGISLLGQSTSNYAHWLTETLPKLSVILACRQYDDLPLLVDVGHNTNIYNSIHTVCGKKRQVILVERWQSVHVGKLLCVSQAGYEPYIPHGLFNTGTPRIVNTFSEQALCGLKDRVLNTLGNINIRNCSKIFLCRSDHSNNLRNLTNSAEIEELLQKKGYIFIDPTKLSFAEQVQVCNASRIIVAPIGAALANMVFASADCKILALSPYYENANFYFYSNLAAILKLRFFYLLGSQTDQRGHPMHKSYSIDLTELERALDLLQVQ